VVGGRYKCKVRRQGGQFLRDPESESAVIYGGKFPPTRHGRGLARPPTRQAANHIADLRRRVGWPGQVAARTWVGLIGVRRSGEAAAWRPLEKPGPVAPVAERETVSGVFDKRHPGVQTLGKGQHAFGTDRAVSGSVDKMHRHGRRTQQAFPIRGDEPAIVDEAVGPLFDVKQMPAPELVEELRVSATRRAAPAAC